MARLSAEDLDVRHGIPMDDPTEDPSETTQSAVDEFVAKSQALIADLGGLVDDLRALLEEQEHT